jgi:uncharacterized protein (DUF302 family)
MNQDPIEYGMHVHVEAPFSDAVERVVSELKKEGFGVLTEIDVKKTLKTKLDADFRQYVILGACNPPLAYQALQTELEIGLLLPCNVIVYEDDSGTGSIVSIVDPMAMLGVAIAPDLDRVAEEARARLERVRDSLAS